MKRLRSDGEAEPKRVRSAPDRPRCQVIGASAKVLALTRNGRRQPRAMARKQSPNAVRQVAALIERGPVHSTLYYWLLDHHDELARAAGVDPIHWGPLCEQFASLGLTDQNGAVASPATARQTWLRVRKAVQRARLVRATGIKPRASGSSVVPPSIPAMLASRAPGSTAVVGTTALPASPAANPTVEIGDTKPGVAGPVGREVAKARIAEVRQSLNARSGR